MNYPCKAFVQSLLAVLLCGLPGYVLSADMKAVTVQLNWKNQFEFSAFYAAIEQGYYRDAGLDVSVREGGPGIDAVGEVAAGRADFGVANSSLVIERYSGKPVVALGALMQHSAIGLLAQRKRGIKSLADLEGRPVACAAHSCDEIMAYLLASGLHKEKIHFVPHSGSGLESLKNGEVAATEVYVTNEPYWISGHEHEYLLFTPRSAGIDLFGNILFTSVQMSDKRTDTVIRFRDATIKGWNYALTHQPQVVDLILQRYNTQKKSREHLLYEARLLNELTRPDIVDPGYMSRGRWEHVVNVYSNLDMMPIDYNLDGFLFDAKPVHFPAWLKPVLWSLAVALSITLIFTWQLRRINRRMQQEISDRILAEEALNRSKQDFVELVDHANTLLSHELRTPLAVIKIHLDILELKRKSEPSELRHLNIMRQAVLRLQDLFGEKTGQMFSAGSLASERQHVELGAVLRRVIAEFEALSGEQRIQMAPLNEAHVEAVLAYEMFKTAVFNVLENAVKYSPSDSPIELALAVQGDDGIITVRNRYTAPPPENTDIIFEKHSRGNASDNVAGTGIGLFLVRLIIEAHSGKVTAQYFASDEFVIKITLPLSHTQPKLSLHE